MTEVISAHNLDIRYRMVSHEHTTFKEYVLALLTRKKRTVQQYDFMALKNVSVSISKGESVALIGHNGSGKSTFLKAIAGILPPVSGSLVTHGRIAPMIELGAGFDFELSGLENIRLSCQLMGLSRREIDEKIEGIVRFADLGEFINVPLKAYSSGMAARIGFACATAVDPDILLIDEVLSVGDQNFTKKCLARINELKKNGTTLVLVSHDSSTVRRFCERAYVFEQGELKFAGAVEDALRLQDQIMDRRFLESLPVDVQKEEARRKKLAASAFENQKPHVQVECEIIQDNISAVELDIAREFTIQLKFVVDLPQKIKLPIAFGLALTRDGTIITGFNSLEISEILAVQTPDNYEPEFYVRFHLPNGLPQLEAGYYELLVGVHDDDISRELFFGKVKDIPTINSTLGINKHKYTIDMSNYVKKFEISSH